MAFHFHGHCVVASRICPLVASTTCQRGEVALLGLDVFSIIASVCGRVQVLRHSIKFFVPPRVKVPVALMVARTRGTSFVCSFASIGTKQIPVSRTLDAQRLASPNSLWPLHRLIVRRTLSSYTCTPAVRRTPRWAARVVASGARPNTCA
jgi:hypothetical protein